MALINAKCPECGATLKINDTTKVSLICPYCGSTYLVENAVNQNYITNNNYYIINEKNQTLDLNEEYKNIMTLAIKEMKNKQLGYALKYFTHASMIKPHEWEPVFYREYCKSMIGKVGDCEIKCYSFQKAFIDALNKIIKRISGEGVEYVERSVEIILSSLINSSKFHLINVPTPIKDNDYINEIIDSQNKAIKETTLECIDLVVDIFTDNLKINKMCINCYKWSINNLLLTNNEIQEINKSINRINLSIK